MSRSLFSGISHWKVSVHRSGPRNNLGVVIESKAKSTIILRTRQGFTGKVFTIIFSTSTEYELYTASLGSEKAQQQELNI